MAVQDIISARLARHGFRPEDTGGGCMAYVRRDQPAPATEIEETFSRADWHGLPADLQAAVILSTVNVLDGTSDDEPMAVTLGQVLEALADPAVAEYELLSLKIYNSPRARRLGAVGGL